MSAKSERKKRNKEQKQKEAAAITLAVPRLRKWYAEDAAEFLDDHRKHCTDPACTTTNHQTAIGYSMQGEKMVAMLFPQRLNEIFFALYGTGTGADYKPFMSLQLANPEDIRAAFNADGTLRACVLCEGKHAHKHEYICLAFTCHNEGVAVCFEPDGATTIRCKKCNNWMRSEGFAQEFRLAPRPKAEYPSLFCNRHGIQPGYVVCIHVLDGERPPAILLAADAKTYGQVWCEDCEKLGANVFDDKSRWTTMCQSSLDERSNGQLRQLLAAMGQEFYVPPSTVLEAPTASASLN